METTEIIAELRKHGLSNGGTLGWHSGLCDEAADRLEYLDGLVNEWEGVVNGITHEPVIHAHWIERTGGTHNICSNCHTGVPKIVSVERWQRCCMCGAHMDEEVADG